jgi:hypothetical protein
MTNNASSETSTTPRWAQGRERVVRDLGPGGADAGDERGLAGVGKAHEAHVREEPELESELPLLPEASGLMTARRSIGGGGEGSVSSSAPSAARDEQSLSPPSSPPAALFPRRKRECPGTESTRSSPVLPVRLAPSPFLPRSPR